jgi:hypothetical protein
MPRSLLITSITIAIMTSSTLGQTRPAAVQTRPATTRSTTPARPTSQQATSSRPATSAQSAGAAANPTIDEIKAIVRELNSNATRDRALGRLRTLPPSAIPALSDIMLDDTMAEPLRKQIDSALMDIYTRGRTDRIEENSRLASAWGSATGINAYKRIGTNAKWDAQVLQGFQNTIAKPDVSLASLKSAFDAGCKDPLVRFVYVERSLAYKRMELDEALHQLIKITDDLDASKYPAGRKLYANLTFVKGAASPQCPADITEDKKYAALRRAISYYPDFVRENPGPTYLRDVATQFYNIAFRLHGGYLHEPAYNEISPMLAKALPNSALGSYMEANYYAEWAWEARGSGWADTVTEEGWKGFGERLDKAQIAAEKGWHLDPLDSDCASVMITVCMGKGLGRETMETWFQRAIRANPHSLAACGAKMLFLLPKWGGSEQEALEFGRWCVTNGDGKDRLPMVLLAAYGDMRTLASSPLPQASALQYWTDAKLVYQKLLADKSQLQTNRAVYLNDRAAFVKLACDCQQWADAVALFKEFGTEIDVAAFGGQALYDFLQKKAETELAKTK